MADELNLQPCPFCGGTNIDPAEWSGNDGAHGPGCGDCGALADSAELWNRRAPSTSTAPPDELPNLEDIDLTYAIAGKVAEFYPQETPRDMEKNHRLARAIQRLPLLRQVVRAALASKKGNEE